MSEIGSPRRRRSRCAGLVRRIVVALVLSALGSLAPAAAETPLWNPRPEPDDVTFSLPCDQKLAMRRVVTQTGGEAREAHLDDRRFMLGRSDDNSAYFDYYRQVFIAGPFADQDARFYLIGKYELTELQYNGVMTGSCSGAPDQPAANMSWYDAVEFTRRLTRYIRTRGTADMTAAAGQEAAYFRLPTEAEWEFAARGGLAASPEEFRADRLPLDGDPASAVWYNDPGSAQGHAESIGLLSPNPLRLYDMHGNVAEMLIEPFRLNRAGREHGLAGGFIDKGGSFRSGLEATGNAARREHGYFRAESADEFSSRDVGIRVVLAGPAILSPPDTIREEWRRAGLPRRLEGEDPVAQLSGLQHDLSDLPLIRSIEEIKQSILSQASGRNDAQYRLLESLLLGSGRLVLEIRQRQSSIFGRKRTIEAGMPDDLSRKLIADNAEDESEIADFNYFLYDLLSRAADEFSGEEIVDRKARLIGELRRRELDQDEITAAVSIAGDIAELLARRERRYDRQDIRRLATRGLD